MTTWTIEYTYDERSTERDALRPEHREYLASLAESGRMPAYGRFEDDGPAGALLIAQAETRDEVDAMIAGDPFVIAGLVPTRTVRHWPATWAPRT